MSTMALRTSTRKRKLNESEMTSSMPAKQARVEGRAPLHDKNGVPSKGIDSRFGFKKSDRLANKENQPPESRLIRKGPAAAKAQPTTELVEATPVEEGPLTMEILEARSEPLGVEALKAELLDGLLQEHDSIRDEIKTKKIGKKAPATKTNMNAVIEQRASLYSVGKKIFEAIDKFTGEAAAIEGTQAAQIATLKGDLDERTQCFEEKVVALRGELGETSRRLVASEQQVDELQLEIKAVSEAHGEVVVEKTRLENSFAEATATITRLEAEAEASRKQILQKEKELSEAEVRQQDLAAKAAAAEEAHAAEKARMESESTQRAEREAERFEAARSALTGELDGERQKVRELNDRRTELENQLSTLHGEAASYREKYANAVEESSRCKSEIDALKVALAAKEAEASKAMETFSRVQKFSEERTNVLAAEKETLQAQHSALQEQKLVVEEECRELRNLVATLERDLAAAKESISSLTSENATLAEAKALAAAKLDFEAAEWARTKEALEAEKAAAEEARAAAEVSHATQMEEVVQANLAQVEELKSAHTAEATALSEKNAQLEKEAQVAQQELNTFKKHCGVSNEKQLENLVALSIEAEELRNKLASHEEVLRQLDAARAQADEYAKAACEAELRRRKMHNQLQEMRGNVRVVARVRPFLPNDGNSNPDETPLTCSPDGTALAIDSGGALKDFTFDRVFNSGHDQAAVFDEVSNLVQSALDGYHVCLFSYGQTGSGKTHTMQGATRGDQRGIIPRSVEKVMEVAEFLKQQGWAYDMEATFVEVYNEAIRDLLPSGPSSDGKSDNLAIKHDAAGRVEVPGLVRMAVKEADDIVTIMELAHKNRSVASTKMNDVSSRSHCIFTLHLKGRNMATGMEVASSLNLCDLAGSERLSRSEAQGDRLKETQAINKSLSALSDVFLALASKASHVPYRNSKLTHLLQNCFSGDGKTLMFVNLSPTVESVSESLCSLRFSAKVHACELKGKPKKNVVRAAGMTSTRPTTAASNETDADSKSTGRAAMAASRRANGFAKELARSKTTGGPDKKKARFK